MNAPKLLFVALMLALLSCAANHATLSEEALLGEWEVTLCEIQSEEISPALVQGAMDEMKSSVYTFEEGGRLKLDAPANDEHIEGGWVLDAKRSSLTLTHLYKEAPTEEQYEVRGYESGKLSLYQDMGGLGSISLFLEKVK